MMTAGTTSIADQFSAHDFCFDSGGVQQKISLSVQVTLYLWTPPIVDILITHMFFVVPASKFFKINLKIFLEY